MAIRKINFSCFSISRSESGGVRYGECSGNYRCSECGAYNAFYGKAEEFQRAGNPWGKSVALARAFFWFANGFRIRGESI